MGTTTRTRSTSITASGAAAVLLLTGCTGADGDAAGPTPTTTTTVTAAPSTPEPTATPEPWGATEPTAALDLDCGSLLSAGTAAAVDASWLPRDAYDRADVLPDDYAIAQEGGLACQWDNGERHDGKGNAVGGSGYAGLRVEVLPRATEDWARYVEIYGEGPEVRENCFSGDAVDGPFTRCSSNQMVGDTWVALSMNGFELPAGGDGRQVLAPVLAEVTAAVGSADVTDEASSLGGPLPGWSCVPGAELEAAAVPEVAGSSLRLPTGGWSLYASAWARAQAAHCSTTPDGGTRFTTEAVLVGGAWALRQRLEFDHVDEGSAVTVAGLDDGSAFRSCDDAGCTTDLVIGEDWVRLVVRREAVPDAEGASERYAAAYVERATAA
ncbi:hypothetical protein [Frigoribacterium salinisoli]